MASTQDATKTLKSSTQETALDVAEKVAWDFVTQYYTHLHSNPDELYRYYTKGSTMVHGVEGTKKNHARGQAEIKKAVSELKYKESKVYVHSIDAQPSEAEGIFIVVIGEYNNPNNDQEWHKFIQSFFLAPQPTGYYVKNDIFRELKEEPVEDEEETDHGATSVLAEPYPTHPQNDYYNKLKPNGHHVQHEQELYDTPAPEPIPVPQEVPPVVEPVREPISETVPEPAPEPPAVETKEATPAQVPQPVPEPREPTPPPVPEVALEKSPAPPSPKPVPAEAPAASPSPAVVPASNLPPPAQPVAASTLPPAPSAPKTWANLAAANSSKWGTTVAQEAKGVSAAAPPAATPPPAPATPQPQQQKYLPRDQQSPLYAAALSITTAQCFVKGVTDNIPDNRLTEILTQRFGPIKDIEIVRNRACAFLEFKSIESAKRAIIASLPTNQGGEGGIRLDEKEFGPPARLNVEIRKERGDRPAPRGRGGSPGGPAGSSHSGAGSDREGSGRPAFRGGAGNARGRGRGDGARGGTK